MANKRRAKAAARGRRKPPAADDFRHSVFLLVDAMADQLRRASHMTFVLSMIDTRHDEEAEAIAFQALEIRERLDAAAHIQNRLFRLAAS